jgi:ribosomal protein S21
MTNLSVTVIDDNADRALCQLKPKLSDQGVIRDMKRHETAMRPSERQRAKHSRALKEQRKAKALLDRWPNLRGCVPCERSESFTCGINFRQVRFKELYIVVRHATFDLSALCALLIQLFDR